MKSTRHNHNSRFTTGISQIIRKIIPFHAAKFVVINKDIIREILEVDEKDEPCVETMARLPGDNTKR
jgi:hypothetical protein